MVSRVVLAACCVLLAAGSAAAKGWDAPAWGLKLSAFGTTKAFPGSTGAGPDQGLDPGAEISSGLRLSSATKLALSASAGGHVQNQFTKGNYGWLGAQAMLRRNRTTATLEGQWTPRRNKFPTDPEEGGEYHGASLTAGVRQAAGDRVRLRLEGTLDREKFVPVFADRDAVGRELFGQAVFTPVKGIDLRLEGSLSHDQTTSRKYTKDTHWLGAGGVWSDSVWRADLGARSGVHRYPDAILGDTNFQRRDQWIELRLRVGRALRPGLSASAAGSLVDQTSSRFDRHYTAGTITLGLEWTGGGK